jgi:ATP-dependent HslUV protease ATP-binding subunit HslU
MEGTDVNFSEMLQDLIPKKKKRRTVHLHEARRILIDEELKKLVDMDDVVNEALDRVENHGVIFIDEIDKITGARGERAGPDVSREGVQRDLLPLVEGCTVSTRYGMVRTDHVLFIASGAFSVAKPSDLIPELQGRFPIRVELSALGIDDFVRILTEPSASLTEQYRSLLATERVELEFDPSGVRRLAEVAYQVNDRSENIGARRLHTVLERLLETVSFEAADRGGQTVVVDAAYVDAHLTALVQDEDLSRYIL